MGEVVVSTQPGWYDDRSDPRLIRWWDGHGWTAHTQPKPGAPGWGGPDSRAPQTGFARQGPPVGYGAAPGGGFGHQPPTKKWDLSKKIGVSVAALLGVAVIVSAVSAVSGAGGGDDNVLADQRGVSASDLVESAPRPDRDEGGDEGGPTLPKQQVAFLRAVAEGQSAVEGVNELKVVQARRARSEALCAALPTDQSVRNWVGTVESVETTLGGDGGVLSLEIAQDVAVQTWNNGLSDLGSGTLVNPDSPLFDRLAELDEGQQVYFSGRFDRDRKTCVAESSLLDESGMRTPDFVLKFTNFGLVEDGPLEG